MVGIWVGEKYSLLKSTERGMVPMVRLPLWKMKRQKEEKIKGINLNEEGSISWFCAVLFSSILFWFV